LRAKAEVGQKAGKADREKLKTGFKIITLKGARAFYHHDAFDCGFVCQFS